MTKPVKTYGLVMVAIIGSLLSLAMILGVIKIQFNDILSNNNTTYSQYHNLAKSSTFENNLDLKTVAKPELSVTSYKVSKGDRNFDYFGQASCNGSPLSIQNFLLDKRTIHDDEIKLEIYAIEEGNLYGNLNAENKCSNIRDDYMNVPSDFILIRDSLYSYNTNGTTYYAKKINDSFYSTDSNGSYTGTQLNVKARIDTRGTYYLKYVVTNAKGVSSTAYINIIVN